MTGFKKECLIGNDSKMGKGSFYGVHGDTEACITPQVIVPAPPNDLIGPHLLFNPTPEVGKNILEFVNLKKLINKANPLEFVF